MKTLVVFLFIFHLQASGPGTKLVWVFLNKRTDQAELPKEELDRLMTAHQANIERLAKEGKLIVAGPFDGGGGIFVFNSGSIEEVTRWLSSDPGVSSNRWRIEILNYTPRVGSACAAAKPYEMVTYNFVRYIANATKYNVSQAPQTARKHDDYIKQVTQTGNVIAEGIFGDDGGILIMKGDLDRKVIEADPSLADELYQVEFKKLWVAKGAFCEK